MWKRKGPELGRAYRAKVVREAKSSLTSYYNNAPENAIKNMKGENMEDKARDMLTDMLKHAAIKAAMANANAAHGDTAREANVGNAVGSAGVDKLTYVKIFRDQQGSKRMGVMLNGSTKDLLESLVSFLRAMDDVAKQQDNDFKRIYKMVLLAAALDEYGFGEIAAQEVKL